jgi:methionyl-tRNA formyltransferase
MNKKLKIIFAGTPEISRQVLASILKHDFQVDLVLTQPDRPAGRGMKLTPSPVKQLALEQGIEVFQPLGFRKDPQNLAKIRELAPDLIVVVAYGIILPQALLDIPRLGCVNIHVSLLPRWRGAAPIQRAVLAGDEYSGVTIMQMDAGLDTGDMLIVEKIKLAAKETSASLHDKLAQIGAQKIVEFLQNPEQYLPQVQSEDGVNYAHKLDKVEARINWNEDASEIERKIRGYNPFPGAYSYLDVVLHKFWAGEVLQVEHNESLNGTILRANDDQLWIACGGQSVLAINEIQEAGSKRKTSTQYLQNKTNLLGKFFKSESLS